MSIFFSRRAQVEPAKTTGETNDGCVSDGSGGVKPQASSDKVTEDRKRLKNDGSGSHGSGGVKPQSSKDNVAEDQEKSKANNSPQEENEGDYVGAQYRPIIKKFLEKQVDKQVLFADKVLKFTCSGKIKRRILLITNFALYIVDPETDSLKRRIILAAIEKLYMSELKDHFFAIIIPTEYDLLMGSTRKNEIVTVLVDAIRSASDYELEVFQSNRFVYSPAADIEKEIVFEEVEGGVKTRIVKK